MTHESFLSDLWQQCYFKLGILRDERNFLTGPEKILQMVLNFNRNGSYNTVIPFLRRKK